MLGILSRLVGRKQSSNKKSCSCGNSCSKSLKSLKGKGLRFEPLEARQLLSVSPVILDNGDTQHYQETGSNWASWSDTNAYGQNFRYHAQGDGTSTARWTFDTLEAGKNYQLFATYTAEANRPSNAPFTVLDGTSSLATVRINEHFAPIDSTFADHGWQSLGTYHTDTGSLTIRLSDDANGYVIADAVAAIEVLPVTVAPTVVDNANPAYSEQGSNWLGWSDTTAYSGAIRYHAPGTGQNKATWTFEALDPTKSYRVLATWSAYDSHASNAPYTVSDDTTALATVRLNQQFAPNNITLDGQGWQNVGTYQATSGKLVISLSDDTDGYAIADAVRLVEVQPPVVAPTLIDNSDVAYGETGNNWLSWSETGAYQGDFRYHAPGSGQNTATWIFEALDPTKRYQVYTTWSPQPNRSTNSPFSILDDSNPLATVRVNQQFAPVHASFDGQSWESLGTYQFVSGKLTVSLSDDVSSGYVIADAVRIVEVPEVTTAPLAVDNADAAYAEIGEDWLTWSETGAYQGDFRYHTAGTSQNAVTWTFDKLDPTKQYRVYATWSAQSNLATDAPYTILDDQTSMGTVRVNQQLAPESATFNNQSWQILGTYHFASGKLTVTLSDDATSGYVVADAIYVEAVPQVPGTPGIADNADAAYTETGSGWSDHSGSGDYLGNSRRHAPGSGENKALWQFTDLPAGHYDIYAIWTAATDQATNAPFTVYDGSNLAGTERVNQQLTPASETADGAVWQLVGSYWIESGQMRVELSNDANGIVTADAIRIVDPVTLYWDANGAGDGLGGGGGVWDTTTLLWNTDPNGNGTLQAWSNGAIAVFCGSTAGAISLSGQVQVSADSLQFLTDGYTIENNSLQLTGTHSILVDPGLMATISSPISGSVGLTKTGLGTLTLSGASTYTSTTAIQNGSAVLTGSLNSSTTVTLGNGSTGGTLQLGDASAARNQTIAGLFKSGTGTNRVGGGNASISTLTVNVSGTNPFGGVLGGSGNQNNLALIKSGTGALTLSGANTFTGTTTISAGTLTVASQNALQSSTVNYNYGTLNFSGVSSATLGGLQGSRNLASNVALTVGYNNTDTSYSGVLSGGGSLIKTGTGVLTLSGISTYSGETAIRNGTVKLSGGDNRLPRNYGNTLKLGYSNGGTTTTGILDLGGYSQMIVDFTNDPAVPSSCQIIGNSSTTSDSTLNCSLYIGGTFAGVIQDSLPSGGTKKTALHVGVGGTLTLTGANTFSGETHIDNDEGILLVLNNQNALQNSTVLNMPSFGGGLTSATFGGLSGSEGLALPSGFTLTVGGNNASTTYSGVLSGPGSLVKTGGGTLTLSGANTYSGNTSIIQGTLAVSDMDDSNGSSNVGTGPNPITLSDGTYEGILSYTGDSTNFDRGFIVTSGGSGRINVADGKTLTLECDSQNFQNAGVLTIGGAGNTTITSSSNLYITSGGTLFKTDAGTLSIINSSSTHYFYCDDVTVDEGKVDTQGEFLFVAARIHNGGTLQVSGTLDLSTPLVNQGTLIIEGQGNVGVGTPSMIGNSAALSGTELYATWIGFDQSNVEVTKYISLDGTNYLPFTEGNATDTSVLISGVNPNTDYYVKVVVAHADGITEIYQSGLLHTASADTSGWYKINNLIPHTNDPVKNLDPNGLTAYILPALLPGETAKTIGAPYSSDYSFGVSTPQIIGDYQKIGSWTYAGSKQGAFLQSILGLITDGSIPTLDEQGQVTFYHTLEIHDGAVRQDLGYSFAPTGGYSQIMHFQGTSTTEGPLTFDPNPPCTCPGSGTNAGVPSGTTGGSVVGITPIDSTGGCVPCGGGSSALTYQSRGNNFDSGFGPGWSDAGEMPSMIVARNTAAIQAGGNSSYFFDYASGSGYTPRYCSTQTLLHDPVNNLYIFTQTDGTRYEFYDDIQNAHPAGTLYRSISPSGATTQVTAWTASGKIAEVRYKTAPSGSPYEIKQYEYYGSGSNSGQLGHVQSITLRDGQSNILRKTNYDYYAEGDLKTIVSQKWDPTLSGLSPLATSDTNYFRYYTTTGKEHLLKRMLLPNAYASALSWFSVGNLDGIQEEDVHNGKTIADFTCFYYEYDGNRRVEKSVVFGQSNTTEFTNTTNPNTTSKGYNVWYRKSVETRLDGTTNTIYTNFIGQTILTDLHDLVADTHTISYSRYDSDGRVVLAAETSAFVAQNSKFYNDTLPDLVDFGTGESPHSPYLSDTEGLFQIVTYYGDNPGEATGQVHQTAVAQGESAARKTPGTTGGPVLLTSYQYDSHTADYGFDDGSGDQVTLYPVSSKTTYPDGDPAHGVSITYTYTWNTTYPDRIPNTIYPDRFQIQESTTTLPAVSNSQNGSDHTSTTKTWSNDNGNVVWSMNQVGRVTYTHYNTATNLPEWTIEDIDDVKAASLTLAIPSGWDLPDSDGANQLTEYQYDALRRVIRILGPKHLVDIGTYGTWVRSATWTVYNDAKHETRTAQGYATESVQNSGNWDTFTIVGPISIQITDRDGRVTNQIQATYANPPTNAGLPAALATATFSRSVYVTWTAYQYKKTKLWKTAVYYDIPSDSASNGADGFVGDKDVNFNMTTVGYENFGAADYALIGRQNKTISSGGTITRNVFDARGNVLETWIGTHDEGATDAHPDHYSAGQTNDMVKVASYLYDADGNMIQSTQYADSDNHDLDRVTKYFYDGRDQLVYTVNPADAQGQVTYSKNYYDNLGRVVMQQTYYDADQDLFTTSFNPETTDLAGHLAEGTLSGIVYGNDRLLSCTTTDYDNLGRVYRTTNYAVNPANGQLVNNGQNTATSLSSNVWYDAAGRVIKQEATGSQTFTKTAYNGLGQVKFSYVGYDDVGGESTSNLYDYQGKVNLDLADDIILSQTEYAYDDAGNTLFVTSRQRNATAVGNDYDALEFGNSRSTYVGYWYDGFDRQIASGDYGDNDDANMTPGSRQVHAPLWSNGNGILVTRTEYNAQGRVQSVFDAANHETRYTQYDAAGRAKQIVQNYQDGTYSAGTNNSTTDQDIITTYDYAANGKIWKQTDTLGNVTEYLYNGLGQLEERKDPDPDGTATVYYSPTTTYTYNNLGEILTTTQSDAAPTPTLTRTTTYTYDNLGRRQTVTQQDPDNLPGGEVAPSTTTAYDVRGNVHTVTDALGHATTYAYDAWNRLATQTDAANHSTTYTYYDTGAMESLTDPEQNTTTWTYDKLNRVIQEENELDKSRYYTYDGGLLSRVKDRENRITEYDYDRYGRQFHEYWYTDELEAENDPYHNNPDYYFQYQYDELGNLIDAVAVSAAGNGSGYSYGLDDLGRATLIVSGYYFDASLPSVSLSQQYDGNGNRLQVSTSVDTTNDYVNDYQYDNLGRMTQVQQHSQTPGSVVASKRVDFTYLADGSFDTITRYANLAGTQKVGMGDYGYDNAGRLTSLTYGDFPTGSSPAPAYTWNWDEGNRIEQFTSKTDAATGYDHATVDYNYDAMNQLANVGTTPAAVYSNWATWTGVQNENYEYDDNGNRINGNYEVGDDNQMTADNAGFTYTYDDEGNRTEKFVWTDDGDWIVENNEKSNLTEYHWDNRNRLTNVVHRSVFGGTAEWSEHNDYDYLNRLIYQDVQQGATEKQTLYAYDGNQIALQFEKSGSDPIAPADLAHRYLWGPAVDQLLADEALSAVPPGEGQGEGSAGFDLTTPGTTRWALGDNLNSVRDLATYDGVTTSVIAHRVFDAFGVLKSETDPSNNHQPTNVDCHLYYTGKLYDNVTGLQNNLNRWYEPATGKWISQDPIRLAGGDTNLYRYVNSNPIIYRDSSGLYINAWLPAEPSVDGRIPAEKLYELEKAIEAVKYMIEHQPDPESVCKQWVPKGYDVITHFRTYCDVLVEMKIKPGWINRLFDKKTIGTKPYQFIELISQPKTQHVNGGYNVEISILGSEASVHLKEGFDITGTLVYYAEIDVTVAQYRCGYYAMSKEDANITWSRWIDYYTSYSVSNKWGWKDMKIIYSDGRTSQVTGVVIVGNGIKVEAL